MDSDFIKRMQRINLTAEEGEIIQVCPRQRERLLEECSLRLRLGVHKGRKWDGI